MKFTSNIMSIIGSSEFVSFWENLIEIIRSCHLHWGNLDNLLLRKFYTICYGLYKYARKWFICTFRTVLRENHLRISILYRNFKLCRLTARIAPDFDDSGCYFAEDASRTRAGFRSKAFRSSVLPQMPEQNMLSFRMIW